MLIKYWRSRNIMDTRGENVECTVKQLFSFLHKSRLHVPSKNKVPVWAPVSFKGTRSAANVENIYCMVFDIDDGLVYWDIETKICYKNIYYWHQTYSHTDEHWKFRLVFPLHRPVPKEEWLDYWEAGQKWFTDVTGHKGTDQVCKDAGRCYYVKASKDHTEPWGTDAWEKTDYLNLDDYVKEIREEKKFKAKVKADLQKRQKELLKNLPRTEQERLERYKKLNSKEARTRKANELGAVIKDGIARKILCPRCNRKTVWFGLDPGQKSSAECNHKNSCGWFGFVNTL